MSTNSLKSLIIWNVIAVHLWQHTRTGFVFGTILCCNISFGVQRTQKTNKANESKDGSKRRRRKERQVKNVKKRTKRDGGKGQKKIKIKFCDDSQTIGSKVTILSCEGSLSNLRERRLEYGIDR